MGMLAIVNMFLLLLGFLMRLRKHRRIKAAQPTRSLVSEPFTEAQEG